MAKWRMLEETKFGFVEKIKEYAGKNVFVTFVNDSGRLDVTTATVKPRAHRDSYYLAAGIKYSDECYSRIEGEPIAWMPAILPNPFTDEAANTEWIRLEEGLPELGRDVYVTLMDKKGNLNVTHARLNQTRCSPRNECAFYDVGSHRTLGDRFSNFQVFAWMPAKLPRPFNNQNTKMAFNINRKIGSGSDILVPTIKKGSK